MDKIKNFLVSKDIITSAGIILFGIIIYFFLRRLTNKIVKTDNNIINNKRKTYVRLFRNIIKYIIVIAVILIVLQINGINVTSLITGLGIISVIAGLALQDALKDIIMGFNIIVDNYFNVGDVIKIDNLTGIVVELGLKRTKIKDIDTGDILSIANRNITQALVLSNKMDIDITLPYEEKLPRIEEILNLIIEEISKIKEVSNVEYKNIEEFGDSAIFYRIRIYCNPELKPEIRRNSNRIIKDILDENNISIPYKQIDIHNK